LRKFGEHCSSALNVGGAVAGPGPPVPTSVARLDAPSFEHVAAAMAWVSCLEASSGVAEREVTDRARSSAARRSALTTTTVERLERDSVEMAPLSRR